MACHARRQVMNDEACPTKDTCNDLNLEVEMHFVDTNSQPHLHSCSKLLVVAAATRVSLMRTHV